MRVSDRNVLGTLLHLPRFYNQKLPKLLVLIKRLVQVLKVHFKLHHFKVDYIIEIILLQEAGPPYVMDYNLLRERLKTGIMLKKIFATSELRKYVQHDEAINYIFV